MQSEDLGAKAIVFSQFVNMLDIISYRLQRGGLRCVKLSGSMTLEQRDKCISSFKGVLLLYYWVMHVTFHFLHICLFKQL